MSKKDNGGPAFPQLAELGDIAYTTGGMTLRDYFAAKAMQAMISHRYKVNDFTDGNSADEAYSVADAMLCARDA